MVNTNLELNINTLKNYTINMIKRCDVSLEKSMKALRTQDDKKAREVIKEDKQINELREYIIDRSIELMALKQPMARDLRYVYALGNIAIELERVGDYSANVAEEFINININGKIECIDKITEMFKECREMLLLVIESLENEDAKLAYNIALKDEKVDELYRKVQENCITIMNENPSTINQGVRILFIARHLERIGDHITNVCEKVIYAINGEIVEIG